MYTHIFNLACNLIARAAQQTHEQIADRDRVRIFFSC